MNKEDLVYICNKIFLKYGKNKVLPIAKLMELESIMLNEMRKTNITLCQLHVESKDQNKQNRNRLIDTENKQMTTRGKESWTIG